MEAGEYGLTRLTSLTARRLEVVAVAGMLWISWCVLGAAGFRIFHLHFQIRRAREVSSVDSVKGQQQPANLPTKNSLSPIPNRCTIYYCAPT